MLPLDQLFVRVRRSAFLYRFAWFNRILLATAFIPTGAVKLMGNRFTTISPEVPIGAFFEAMYQTGLWWRFIGLTQVAAGILLLIPLTSHLGAALFLPIVVNILIITIGVGFGGTPMIVAPMVLAVTFLCCWDWHRFRGLFVTSPFPGTVPAQRLEKWERVGFWLFALSLMNFFGITRSFLPSEIAPVLVVTGLLAGLFTLGRFFWLKRKDRVPVFTT